MARCRGASLASGSQSRSPASSPPVPRSPLGPARAGHQARGRPGRYRSTVPPPVHRRWVPGRGLSALGAPTREVRWSRQVRRSWWSLVVAGLRCRPFLRRLEAIPMRTTAERGCIYRRCGCRDILRHQVGAHCPHLLTDGDHGTWTFAVGIPAPRRHRTTVDAAEVALRKFQEGEASGFNADPNQTVANYLRTWLTATRRWCSSRPPWRVTGTTFTTTSSPPSAP